MGSEAPLSLGPGGLFASLHLPQQERKAGRRGKQGVRDKEQGRPELGNRLEGFCKAESLSPTKLSINTQQEGSVRPSPETGSRKLKPPGHSPSTELES